MNGKDSCNRKPEAATISDILYLFCQGNLFLPGKAQRKSQGILISDACSSHYILSLNAGRNSPGDCYLNNAFLL